MNKIIFAEYKTSVGRIGLFSLNSRLCFLALPNIEIEAGKVFLAKHFAEVEFIEDKKDLFLHKTIKELENYFSGKNNNFSTPITLIGTEFQKNIWQMISQIAYGKTRSYNDLAKQIEKLGAVRAVGTACGANPIPIIVPCHRVVGSGGKITGYAGGVALKKYLLELESSAQKLL